MSNTITANIINMVLVVFVVPDGMAATAAIH